MLAWRALVAGFSLAASAWAARPETAEAIMVKVAENQQRAERARSAFLYQQSVLIRFHRGGGKLAREELSEYTISPTPDGTKKDRTRFLGKYRQKNKLHEYYEPHYNYKDVDLDGELISDLAEDLTADRKSRDGISKDLFPLTAAKQKRYQFRLEGTEEYKGRNVYRITFQPVNNTWKDDGPPWAGEALIDIDQHQPVLITTKLARGLPVWVKIVLGTSLKYVGFKMTYKEFDDGIWFPVSYGGEFEVRAVFFYKRKISLSLRNSGFQRADVNSTVTYLDPVQ